MKTCTLEITLAVTADFDDNATDEEIRDQLGDLIDETIENTDTVYTLIKQADIRIEA